MVTMSELRAWATATILFLVALLLLAGCATIQQYQAEQARLQTLVDRIAAHYQMAPAFVRLTSPPDGRYLSKEHVIELPKGASDFLVAHESGHAYYHDTDSQLAIEERANEFAVRALHEALGWSERGAADAAIRALVSSQWRKTAIAGHASWCHEIASVLAHHPEATEQPGTACPAAATAR
jgi:hypothetical protein